MTRTETRTLFFCASCGNEQAKWFGRCPSCGAWNTAQEAPHAKPARGHWTRPTRGRGGAAAAPAAPVPLDRGGGEVQRERLATGFDEFDRVLGGGIVPGSIVLLGGDPGIGKSTLLLETAVHAAGGGDGRVLYISGEESEHQIRARGERLGALSPDVLVLAETDLDGIIEQIEAHAPRLVIIDSIQSMHQASIASAPGSVSQVRETGHSLVRVAKSSGVPVVLVGHVTKEGDVAGPRVLEHMVDAVLYLEGERYQELRVLRAQKNRFGATTEIGLFEMTERGFRDVPEPSSVLMADRRPGVPGSAVAATLDGSRALLVEVQALIAPNPGPQVQRRFSGLSPFRLPVLLGVLAVRAGVDLAGHDAFASLTGGVRIDETAIDLAVCLAVASSRLDRPVPDDLVVIGEVGLGGEIRRVRGGERRLVEAHKIGFRRAMLPRSMAEGLRGQVTGIELVAVDALRQAIELALGDGAPRRPGGARRAARPHGVRRR
jgi:DNA repair protein RadA/Sms